MFQKVVFGFILASFCSLFSYTNEELIIETTNTSVTVTIPPSLTIFNHTNENPAFLIAETRLDIVENRGNFLINETFIQDPVPLEFFTLEYKEDEMGRQVALITFRSSGTIVQEATLSLWDWDSIQDVNISCSFRFEITSSGSSNYNRLLLHLPSSPSSRYYGLGEQFTHFDLKGYNFTVWTREQGVGRNRSDPLTIIVDESEPGAGGDYHTTYWPQSSFISAQDRFLFALKSKAYAVFNFQEPEATQIQIQSRGVEGYFLHDPNSLLNLVQKTTKLFGRQPPLPDWVYNGAILGVQGGTEKMLDYLAQAEENDVAVSAMWIQDWSGKINTEFGTRVFWNWKWNSTWYPNLDRVIRELKLTKDIRVLAYINPYLNRDGDIFHEGESIGAFLRNASDISSTYIQDFGDFYCGSIDLWNEDARVWYKNVIKENLIRLGFSGWMADFGEYTPLDTTTVNASVSLTPEERHNQYPTLWAKLNREAVEEEGRLGDIVFWSRAGSSGAGRYTTLLWGGDQNVDWSFSDGLPSAVTGALSAAMSGIGLYHFDIGGYTTFPQYGLIRSKELLLRSAEFAVFTPVMRTHEGNQPQANHQVYTDPDTWTKFGRLTRMYKMLSPYTRAVVAENFELGIPAMRPLFLHYEEDAESYHHNYQYLYGPDLIVAPILAPGSEEMTLYLPPNDWVYFWEGPEGGEIVSSGGEFVTVPAPLGYPPVFFRNDSEWSELFRNIRREFQ